MKLKLIGAVGLTVVLVIAIAAPALAHVTTDPDSAPQGGEITLGFRVPNEEANANTTVGRGRLPHRPSPPRRRYRTAPGLDCRRSPRLISTRRSKPTTAPSPRPSARSSGPHASGGGTAPGQFQEFHVLVQQLPKDTDQVVFKALQTYSDGTIVRWIDPVTAGQPAPDHPTPILTLTPAPSDSGRDDHHRGATASKSGSQPRRRSTPPSWPRRARSAPPRPSASSASSSAPSASSPPSWPSPPADGPLPDRHRRRVDRSDLRKEGGRSLGRCR